jgi:hypothetical protein
MNMTAVQIEKFIKIVFCIYSMVDTEEGGGASVLNVEYIGYCMYCYRCSMLQI